MAKYFEIDGGPQVVRNKYPGIYSRLTPNGWSVMDTQDVHERGEEISAEEAKNRAQAIYPSAVEKM